MTQKMNERAFQNFIKDRIKEEGGWTSQLHPGLGSDFGIPDLLTAVDSVGILPVELKIGTIENDTTVRCSAVRPAQISWHYNLTSHGYLSAVLIGIPEGKSWRVYAIDGASANKAKTGFVINEDTVELDARYLTTELDSWASTNSYNFDS